MGNGISVDVDANAAALRAVLQRYEDLKKQDLAIRTDRELYNELLPELQAALEVVIRGPSSLLLPASVPQQEQRYNERRHPTSVGISAYPPLQSPGAARTPLQQLQQPWLPPQLSQQGQRLHPLDGRQVSVLVVDDSHISCKLASRALESINLVPKVAYSGEAALMLLKRDPAAFDFVLLDIVMPGLDGIEVLSRIKHNPALARLPVAMLSGLEDKTLAEVCLHQGAVQVLIKPVKAEDVIAAVNRHVLGAGSPVTPVDAQQMSPALSSPAQFQQHQPVAQPPPPSPLLQQQQQQQQHQQQPQQHRHQQQSHQQPQQQQQQPKQQENHRQRHQEQPVPHTAAHTLEPVEEAAVTLGAHMPSFTLASTAHRAISLQHLYQGADSTSKTAVSLVIVFVFLSASGGTGGAAAAEYAHSCGISLLQTASKNLAAINAAATGALHWDGSAARAELIAVAGLAPESPEGGREGEGEREESLNALAEALRRAGLSDMAFPVLYDPDAYGDAGLARQCFGATAVPTEGHVGERSNAVPAATSTTETFLQGGGLVVLDRHCCVSYRQCCPDGRLHIRELLDHLRSTDTPKAVSAATTVQAGAGDLGRTDPGPTFECSMEPHAQGAMALLQQQQHQHQPQQQHHHPQQHHHQQGPYSTPSSTVGANRITILVVDDSNISSKLAVRKLASLGHRTVHADNGLNALEMLRSGQEVDLVLLDIVMPVMDGVELLTILQADEALRHIPVVMLSGLEDKILAEVCLDSGATAVFLKPLDSDQVQQLIASSGIMPRSSGRRRPNQLGHS